MIDVSRLQRRKVDMTPPPDLRTEDEKVFANVKNMLAEKFPKYEKGLCLDSLKDHKWNEKTFLEKCNAIYFDTLYWM